MKSWERELEKKIVLCVTGESVMDSAWVVKKEDVRDLIRVAQRAAIRECKPKLNFRIANNSDYDEGYKAGHNCATRDLERNARAYFRKGKV